MGAVINFLRGLVERIAKGNKSKLYAGGAIITLIVIFLSGISGWFIERLFLFYEIQRPILSTLLFSAILSSSLASKSLNKSIYEIIHLINHKNINDDLMNLRQKLILMKDIKMI